jgi:hypothetical protein
MAFHRAKKGWMCIKGRMKGEQDYYVHGSTGQTTYEKPEDLMTEQEKVYYTNFKIHKEAAEEYTKKITELQIQLEAATYARDTLLYDSITKKEDGGAKEKKVKVLGGSDILASAVKGSTGGIMSFFRSAADTAYRQKILASDDRARGKQRTDYIQNLLDSADGDGGQDKNK